jgi:hypothetical protein
VEKILIETRSLGRPTISGSLAATKVAECVLGHNNKNLDDLPHYSGEKPMLNIGVLLCTNVHQYMQINVHVSTSSLPAHWFQREPEQPDHHQVHAEASQIQVGRYL